jgi:hypothetical protein
MKGLRFRGPFSLLLRIQVVVGLRVLTWGLGVVGVPCVGDLMVR